jgi:hypothetical protein
MPTEAAIFFAGATGLIAIAGLIGYAIGYSACQSAWLASKAYEAGGFFEQPAPEALNAQYEAWKASQQPERSDA